jgi:transcriptional regulator with XRE-family HTH domain
MNVGERIKQRREELHMTQEELAKKVGYTSRSSIAKVESNANGMVQSKLVIFANALQTTPSYLLGWDDCIEQEDADFIKSLGTIHPKEELPTEIEAINTLLHSYGMCIMKTHGDYYFGEAGHLSEDELNEFINTVTTMVHGAADVLVKKKTHQNRDFFAKKK